MTKPRPKYAVYKDGNVWDGPLTLAMARKTATQRRKQQHHAKAKFTVRPWKGLLA